MTTVNKSIYPPPPPFYQLYTQPPPIPGEDDEEEEEQKKNVASSTPSLPINIYSPPPPLTEPFFKFGELQSSDYEIHELPSDVQAMYIVREGVDANTAVAASSTNATAAAANALSSSATATSSHAFVRPPPSYPSVVDYSLSLRVLNRHYLLRYLDLLASLVPAAGSPLSPQTSESNPALHVEQHLKELNEISTNFALLLTKLRPHQANQTLLQVLMKQIERRKKRKEEVEKSITAAQEFLAQHGVTYAPDSKDIMPLNHESLNGVMSAMHHQQPQQQTNGIKQEHAQVKTETSDAATTTTTSSTTPHDPLAQLRALLDAIPDDI